MNDIPPSLLQRELSSKVARRHIALFSEQFGQGHLYFAYHAAIPLILTPELLYALRANFPCDIHGKQLNISWIAIADLLLSGLCNKVDRELYEIHATVRTELLNEMKTDDRFGEQRIKELSDFLLTYVRPQQKSTNPDVRDLADAQRLAALTTLADTEPKAASLVAYELAFSHLKSLQEDDRAEQWRIASLAETLAEPTSEFAPLLDITRTAANLPDSDGESEEAKAKTRAEIQRVRQFLDDFYNKATPILHCTCPSCFEEIPLWECRIISGKTGQVLKDVPKSWTERRMSRLNPERLDSPPYYQESAHRECPKCAYLLPYNIELVKNITLAIVGELTSGKSHYIDSLIHQIQTEWVGNAPEFARFMCLTPEIEDNRLFKNKTIIPPTPHATDKRWNPLIYELVVYPSPNQPMTIANLMIYDASGEEFRKVQRLVEFARFVFNASAFVFVVDPVSIETIFTQLPSWLQKNLQSTYEFTGGLRRASDMLSSTIDTYERYNGYPEGATLPDVPIAVMVSKSDLFKHLSIPKSYTFMTNPPYRDSIDLGDINAVDKEVRELLGAYKQGDLVATTRRFEQVKFFATSATGEPPDENGNFKNVVPCRCLDPVLWILHQLGIIKARESVNNA